ncbi:MAG TPA: ABC-F family ATP-binding cassette domain-containing protein [candidate division Zixibacteria bacterium]
MTLIRLNNITKTYSANLVLNEIFWQIEEGRKIGLLGSNGAGKTTLFRIITGELETDKGEVIRSKHLKLGFLRQEYQLEDELTLFDEMLKPFSELLVLHDQLRELEHRMSSVDDPGKLLELYGKLQTEYESQGGYGFENKIEQVLYGLGFKKEDFDKNLSILSGGEKNRAALASVLLSEPNLLLLDEPTNHLDIEGTEWLEQYLSEFQGTVVLVSHDRYFLDRIISEVVELENHRLERYSGNFSAYLEQKAERQEKTLKEYEAQREYIIRTEDFIRRNIAGQKTKQAQSRRKTLEKLDKMEKPKTRVKKMKMSFSSTGRTSRALVWTEEVGKKYGERTLFEQVNFSIERYDRIGLIGPNGCGKTTFLKILLGKESLTSGEVKVGSNLDVGYYDQEHEGLDLESTVLDEVWKANPRLLPAEMRSYLAKFLFFGDDVFRKIKSFSGGEQSRVVLAKLILSKPNFLALDEPTNHLDIASREVLENALLEFGGTILVVSHDRYFLNKIVNRIYAFEGTDLKEYLGNYSYYEEKKREKKEKEKRKSELAKAEKRKQAEIKRIKPKIKKRSLFQIEKDISDVEGKLEEIDYLISTPEIYTDWQKLVELNQEKEGLTLKLEKLYKEWEDSSGE